MNESEFLDPRCSQQTLDTFIVRKAILEALRTELSRFKGVTLDVGCGRMPYRSLICALPGKVERYIGLDFANTFYGRPDLEWDGNRIPLKTSSVDCALATEVLEHCFEPAVLLREVIRVLKPGGFFFFTVPFLWPLHDVPHDEHRYTPFSLKRYLDDAGFGQVTLMSLGTWDASLAQMLGLWVRRRPMSGWKRSFVSCLATPLIRYLVCRDRPTTQFTESLMITGIAGTARKPS